MVVTRTERHCHEMTDELYNLCHRAKNLYNVANFLKRQAFFEKNPIPSAFTLSTQLTKDNHPDYRALPAQTAQQVLKMVDTDWASFFALLKEWNANPVEYLTRRHLSVAKWHENPNFGRPRLPRYKEKDGVALVVFTNQQVRIKQGMISFPKKAGLSCWIRTNAPNLHQVRIVPKYGVVFFEVVYSVEMKSADGDPERILSIDLGVNNLATCFPTTGEQPFIIPGKPLKAMNQFFNKRKAKLMACIGDKGTSRRIDKLTHKRNLKVADYLHKTSATIRDYCVEHRIGTVIIGKNDGWKQAIEIGKVNNQKFVSIPHDTLIRQVQYKLGDIGIEVILQEESYTSKIDHFALETMEHHEAYQGKRVRRGLFQSSTGKRINADVNGALGILRKVIGDDLLRGLFDRGCVFQPVKMNMF